MFTGMIEEVGVIERVSPLGNGRRIDIAASLTVEDLQLGDSIAINGVCLTAVACSPRSFSVEAVEETMKKTSFRGFHGGKRVNLERAMKADGRLGGHFVQGHVDAVSRILSIEKREESLWIGIAYPASASAWIIPRGSVAVDGVSLTVAEKTNGEFFVSVIPHTGDNTIFSFYKGGDDVNIEYDMLGKYIVNMLEVRAGSTSMTTDYLKQLGY
ncbi:MAG: riboflavin synthase [Ignavibacteria bacterium]|nr:riboflavin synthase [Ignavibacteria bacterium]